MKCLFCLMCALLLWPGLPAQAQTIIVSGRVMAAETGRALPGATLGIRGGGQSVVTDSSGLFRLELASAHAVLVVSSAGYQTLELPLNGRSYLDIILEPLAAALENVTVHTGYQSLPRERATGSFVKIDSALLQRRPGLNILDRLEGVTSGLYFDRHDRNSGTQLQVRGLSGLLYSRRQPLIVLDNFPYEGNIENINPADIESITVLKDAAAASIWGARAGNGVIVLTTKKGSTNSPPSLSFSSNVMVREKDDLFSLPQISTTAYIDLERFLFDKGAYNADLANRFNYPPLSPVVELLARQQGGQLTAAEATAQIDALRGLDVRRDFQKYLYRTGLTQQYSAQLTGGGASGSYLLSAGLDRSAEQLVGNGLDRYSFRAHQTLQPLKNLQLQSSLQYTVLAGSHNSPGDYQSGAYRLYNRALYPYARLADEAGHPLPIATRYRSGYTDTAGGGKLLDWKFRPLEELLNNDKTNSAHALLGNLSLRYQVLKWLSADLNYQYQANHTTGSNYYNTNTFFTRDLINRFTQLSASDVKYAVPNGGILDEHHQKLRAYSVRSQINVARQWPQHSLNAVAGAELRQTQTRSSAYRTYGYSDRLNMAAVDYTRTYPTYPGGFDYVPSNNGFEARMDRFVSAYVNTAYTYRHRYTLSASARKDASNLYGVASNAKGTPLWSAGAAWKVSGESFYPSWAPALNARITYGYSGNTSPALSALTTLYYMPATNQPVTNLPFASITQYPNPTLRWEKVRMLNWGIDARTKNGRLGGSVEFYYKSARDIFGLQTLDPTTGVGSMMTNSASLKGRGVDVMLNTVNVTRGAFQWSSVLLFNYISNKVEQYLFPVNRMGFVSNGLTIVPVEGYAPYMVVSYRWAGLEGTTGNPQGYVNKELSRDYNALVRTPFEDQVVHGSAVPLYHGSLRNEFRWKGWTLSSLLSYRLAYYFRSNTVSYNDIYMLGTVHADYERRWQEPGDELLTHVPSLIYPNPSLNRDQFYKNAEVTAHRGDHVRLEDVRLAYDMRSPGGRLPFRQLQLYAYVANLNVLLWRKNSLGIDPEYPSGLQVGRTLSLGFKADF